jgi:hypothetical protein
MTMDRGSSIANSVHGVTSRLMQPGILRTIASLLVEQLCSLLSNCTISLLRRDSSKWRLRRRQTMLPELESL